jgi:hypothetical protein
MPLLAKDSTRSGLSKFSIQVQMKESLVAYGKGRGRVTGPGAVLRTFSGARLVPALAVSTF